MKSMIVFFITEVGVAQWYTYAHNNEEAIEKAVEEYTRESEIPVLKVTGVKDVTDEF